MATEFEKRTGRVDEDDTDECHALALFARSTCALFAVTGKRSPARNYPWRWLGRCGGRGPPYIGNA
ncbi:hypothetical protein QTP88_028014 [Uroleucon formosanum]